MSGKTPQEGVSQGKKSKRRILLKGALVVLGASVLIQPSGGVFAMNLQDAPKKGDKIEKTQPKAAKNYDKQKKATPTKKGKKKEETPKKEGG